MWVDTAATINKSYDVTALPDYLVLFCFRHQLHGRFVAVTHGRVFCDEEGGELSRCTADTAATCTATATATGTTVTCAAIAAAAAAVAAVVVDVAGCFCCIFFCC